MKSWYPLTTGQVADLVALVPDPLSYAHVLRDELPDWIPFREKLVDAICLRSDSSSGMIFMANFRRLDRDVNAQTWVLDQEPFLLAVLPTNTQSLSFGMYVHHGDWEGRMERIPASVASAVARSPIASVWPLPGDPPHRSGPITELQSSSTAEAFRIGIKRLAEPR